MIECMNGSTGTARHDDETSADFTVTTSESHAESTWCPECLTDYIACGMGEHLQTVRVLRTPVTGDARKALDAAKAAGARAVNIVD